MSWVKAVGSFVSLCVLCMLTNASHAADIPPTGKQYAFDLETLNSGDKVRKGRTSFAGAVQFNIAATMTDDEGYRSFTMPNGTRVRIGGFVENKDVAGAAVQRLPIEFSVQDEFSTAEAAVVLQIAAEGNLFVTSASDPTLAATKAQVTDKRFLKSHKNYSVTPDDKALVDWVRKNIPAPEASDEGDR